jgi:hypothetical protein
MPFPVSPGLGLVVRHDTGVQFFATPDAVAMASMSLWKVAWMTAVCRVGDSIAHTHTRTKWWFPLHCDVMA